MNSYEDELIAKVAWYYYIEELTQQSISEKLNISRMKVIKYLDLAKKNGVIQFTIERNRKEQLLLENRLCSCYGLNNAYIIPSPEAGSMLNDMLAQAAAAYLIDRISENTFINMGYGETPSKVLNHLATIATTPLSIVSLTGGVSYYLPNAVSNIFKAKLYLYPTPLLLSSSELCQAILKEPEVAAINRMIQLSSLTIVGIGAMNEDATIISNGILNKTDFTCLSMQGAVGDILTHFIDKDGNPIRTSLNDRLVSTPLETLRTLKNVIGIAGGSHKVDVIRSALRGGYLNELITDEETAVALCEVP